MNCRNIIIGMKLTMKFLNFYHRSKFTYRASFLDIGIIISCDRTFLVLFRFSVIKCVLHAINIGNALQSAVWWFLAINAPTILINLFFCSWLLPRASKVIGIAANGKQTGRRRNWLREDVRWWWRNCRINNLFFMCFLFAFFFCAGYFVNYFAT